MHKRKNKRSPKALVARAARKAGPVVAATVTAPSAPKKKAKSTSLLGKLAEKVTDTGLAMLHRIEEIPVVKKAEELVGIRHEEKAP